MKLKSISIASVLTAVAALTVMMSGCIKNDIPYPRIQANFLTIEAEGQTQGASIDSTTRVVNLYFPEETNIYDVHISEYTLTPGAEVIDPDLSQGIDMSQPLKVTLRLYQDYEWVVNGVQEIERYFTVAGQIGTTLIDAPARRVVLYVGRTADIKHIHVETAKLGAIGSTMIPDLNGSDVDFTHPVEVQVTTYGHTNTWTIYAEKTTSSVSTRQVDAWTSVAWVYAQAQAGADNSIEYRLKGDTEWTRVPDEWMTVDGGSFTARIIHLTPSTTYEVRAVSDSMYGETVEFTTGFNFQVPNSSLDQWWLDGKVWNPWPEGGEQYWDTGNKGAATLGNSNSVPTDNTSSGQGWAAELNTRFVGIGSLGKLAAGNLFVGRFVRTDGTNGILSMGRECTERPTRLRGYLKYTTAPINYTSAGFENLAGQPDTCIVWCALIDSPEPFEIRTNPRNRQLFDPNLPIVIAYGKVEYGQTISEYIPFEFELEYKSTSRVPKYILITASASKYGDYFTGGAGATLCLDDIELLYDY